MYLLVGLRSENSASFFIQHEHGRVSRQHWTHVHPRPVSSYGHFPTPSSPELPPGACRSRPGHGGIPRLQQLWHWGGGRHRPQQTITSEVSTAPTQHWHLRVASLQGRTCTSLCAAEAPSPTSSNPSCPSPSPQAIPAVS